MAYKNMSNFLATDKVPDTIFGIPVVSRREGYTNMSVQDKLKLADERLEKLKGTDKYDAFKKRVDAMHAKYEPETTKLGQKLEKAGYSRDIANDATWDYKNNRMGLGPAAADRIRHEADVTGRSKAIGVISGDAALSGSFMAGSVDAVKTSNAVRSATVDTAKGIFQGARDTLAQRADAGPGGD